MQATARSGEGTAGLSVVSPFEWRWLASPELPGSPAQGPAAEVLRWSSAPVDSGCKRGAKERGTDQSGEEGPERGGLVPHELRRAEAAELELDLELGRPWR